VKTVESDSPQMTAIASGFCNSAPAPSPNANGKSPSNVQIVVIKIGQRRVFPAFTNASSRDIHFALKWFVYSSKITALIQHLNQSTVAMAFCWLAREKV